jgi:hypothetical protein
MSKHRGGTVTISVEVLELLLSLGASQRQAQRPPPRWLALAREHQRRERSILAELIQMLAGRPEDEAQRLELLNQLQAYPRSVGSFDKQLAATENLDDEALANLDLALSDDLAANDQLGADLDGLSSNEADDNESAGLGASDGDSAGEGAGSGGGEGGEGA